MSKIIDLHIHTNYSDGKLSSTEVIDEAIKNGVEIISIADHDTIDAYSDELFEYIKDKNITIIPAVEISTKSDKCGIHVLGYNFDINNLELKQKLSQIRNSRHDYLNEVATKLNELGYIVNTNELDKIESVTKAHIARDIIGNNENNDILIKEFGCIPTMGEFIETIMNEGCPAYVKKSTLTPKEAAELIRQASGKVILAHPVAYVHEDNLTEEDILSLVRDMEADGIEANYIYINRNNEKVNEIDRWNLFATNNNLITTIGSDFHTYDEIHPVIGLIGDIELEEYMIKNIIELLK